jgi:hypothetical protein
MGKTTSITIGRLTFKDIKSAASHYGVHPSTGARRMRSGWTPEQAFDLAPPPSRKAHNSKLLRTAAGEFKSIREACEKLGLLEGTVASRMRLGWSVDQSLELESPPDPNARRVYQEFVLQGRTYKSASAIAKAYGVSDKLFRKRVAAGWTIAQGLNQEPPPPRFRDHYGHARDHAWKKPTRIDGKLFPDTTEGAYRLYKLVNTVNAKEYIGITTGSLDARLRGHRRQARLGTKSLLYNAMRRHGVENFSIELIREDALSLEEMQLQEIDQISEDGTQCNGYNTAVGGALGSSKATVIEGKTFPSRQAAAEAYGVDPTVFNLRISRLGWTPEEAAECSDPRPQMPHKITVGGETYPSIKQAAEACNLKYKTVYRRLRQLGWTLDQAFGLVDPPKK